MRKEIDKLGTVRYFNENNKLHREDGPAVEHTNGRKSWRKNGKLHREDGPAMEYANGDKYWFKDGKRHREDGPAIENTNGYKEYWYNDIYYSDIKSDKEWIRFVILMVFQ